MRMIQNYDPLHNAALSSAVAAFPVVLLLIMIASGRIKTYWAAVIAVAATLLVAIFAYHMPTGMAAKATILGFVGGFFPIGWIIVNVIFLYRLTVDKGHFAIFQHSMGSVTADRRMQLLLIAFCFGAFFEGAAGFGTPVAVSAAMLMGLGFSPLAAAGMSLLADTATVAFGALGAPIQGLSASTGLDPFVLGQAIGEAILALLHDHPLLHDLDVLRLQEDVAGVAGHPGGGALLHYSPIPDRQLFQSLYRRRGGRRHLDAGAVPVLARLGAQRHHDGDGAAHRR
jgi:uncharacterized membrane protein YfcA